MNPILEEILKETKALQAIKKDILNTESKFWRLHDNFMKRANSLDGLITRFHGCIDKVLDDK